MFVIEAFGEGFRGKPRQISIAFKIFGKENQMIVHFFSGCAPASSVLTAAGCDVRLATDNRLDSLRVHRVVKRNRAVYIPVVRQRARLHLFPYTTLCKWR